MATPAKTTDTSVMMSLRELRTIEDARRADEAIERERVIAEAKRRADAEEAARRAAEAAVIAARVQAEEDARAREDLARREAELRVREAEAMARAAADAAIAQQRLDQEMELRRAQVARTRPKAMIALLAIFTAASVGLGVMYAAKSSASDEIGAQLDRAKQDQAAQALRIAGLEQARKGNEAVIGGLKDQLHAIGKALQDHPPPVTATVTPPITGHGHHGHHGPGTGMGTGTTGTGTGTGTGTINLGEDCARQPLLCGK